MTNNPARLQMVLPMKLKAPKCPICGDGLVISDVEAWEEDDNGEWIASEITIECQSEPDIDDPSWREWHDWHYRTPYIDWLPLETQVLEWVRTKFYVSR